VIVTVTLNAALDRTMTVPNFLPGGRHRATASLSLPGGKGVNVARALKRMGHPVICTGLAGGRTGLSILEGLSAEGLLNDFVRIGKESRTSTAVVDPTTLAQTEINEIGPAVTEAELATLMEKLQYLCTGAELVVLAGSLPPEVPPDVYAAITRDLRRRKVPTALDCTGVPLRTGLAAEPGVVSPNRREAEEVVGHEFRDDEDAALACETLCHMGAGSALIHDEGGCVGRIRVGKRAVTARARMPRLHEVVSTVGSGDALLAGFLTSWLAGHPPEQCLRMAVACGAANTQVLGAGVFDRADVEAYARQVETEFVA
jgi:1-phosphofructokinase/tagatose 6-phosphate kinase